MQLLTAGSYTIDIQKFCITSSANVSWVFNAVSQKLGTPFSELKGRWKVVPKENIYIATTYTGEQN